MENRRWMYDRNHPGRRGIKQEFIDGVLDFIRFATSQFHYMSEEKIRCPCVKCGNRVFLDANEVTNHLFRKGFQPKYWNWTAHGEEAWQLHERQGLVEQDEVEPLSEQMAHWGNYEHMRWDQRMVYDSARPNFVPHHENEAGPSNVRVEANEPGILTTEDNMGTTLDERFFNVIETSDQPLYDGCNKETQLSAVARFLTIKSDSNISMATYNDMCAAIRNMLPDDNNFPPDYYQHKKLVRDLGLPIVKYDTCPEGCMLYWKEDSDLTSCKFCSKPRYKERRGRQDNLNKKRIPQSVLRYLSLTPRLQRLYASKAIAEHMTWHHTHKATEGLMSHPSDTEAWKHFDRTYPYFAGEPRNIRLS